MSINFQVNLRESDKIIQSRSTQALKKELDKIIVNSANKMIKPIRTLVEQSIKSQPEYLELDNGILAAHFGLPDGLSRIDRIINIWVNNITVRTKKSRLQNKQINTGIKIDIVRKDYSDVLTDSAAIVVTDDGQPLPWLEWLLLFGDTVIVRDFRIKFRPFVGRSRSGLAIMIEEPGGLWGVPSEFSGVANNNFVTRALNGIHGNLRQIILNSFKSSF